MANQSARAFLLKCVQVIGQKASGLASDAQDKLNEINLDTRRREIMSNFPLKAMDLWQNGAELPFELTEMLQELTDIDNKLTLMRAQKYTQIETEEAGEAGEVTEEFSKTEVFEEPMESLTDETDFQSETPSGSETLE